MTSLQEPRPLQKTSLIAATPESSVLRQPRYGTLRTHPLRVVGQSAPTRLRALLTLGLSLPIIGLLGMSPATAVDIQQPFAGMAPLAPSTPAPVHNGNNAVKLTWTDRSTTELVFGVQYRDPRGAWKNASSFPSTTRATTGRSYSYTHTVPYGTIFCYRTSAWNLSGTSYSSEACAVPPAAPTRPSKLRTTGLSAHSVWLAFDRSTIWEWGYRLYTKRAGDSSWVFNKELVSRPSTSTRERMVADNLISDRYYCFRVVAFNTRGQSLPSNEVCATPTQVIE